MAELGPISWASGDSFALPLEGYTPYLLIALGGLSFYAQVLLTKATQMEEAGIVSVVKGSAEVSGERYRSTFYLIACLEGHLLLSR